MIQQPIRYLLLLLPLLLAGCSPKIKLTEATAQRWMGGAAGSGGGTNYAVTISKPESKEIRIDKVWLGNRAEGTWPKFALQEKLDGPRLKDPVAISGNGQYIVVFSMVNPRMQNPNLTMDEGPKTPTLEKAPADLPTDFVEGAVIYYSFGTKIAGHIIVNEFRYLDPLAYP